jgi:hypothetical protein
MSEPRDETLPAGSIDARIDAALREMVAGEGPADARARVMAAIASGRHRARGSRAFPWPGVALVASVLIAAIVLVGRGRLREPSPQAVRTTARAVPSAGPTPDSETPTAALASRVAPRLPPAPVPVRRATSMVGAQDSLGALDSGEADSLPPLEVPPIEGPSPLVLPLIRTTSIDASPLTLPALEIDPLPVEPPLNGSF